MQQHDDRNLGYVGRWDVGVDGGLGHRLQLTLSGSGHCYGASCCDKTSACDADSSVLKSCAVGSCTSTAIGYYCGR